MPCGSRGSRRLSSKCHWPTPRPRMKTARQSESTAARGRWKCRLKAPARSVKSLASLKGKLTAVILGKVETFEFADIDKAKSADQERGGVTVIVESCRKNGDVYD